MVVFRENSESGDVKEHHVRYIGGHQLPSGHNQYRIVESVMNDRNLNLIDKSFPGARNNLIFLNLGEMVRMAKAN